MPMSSSTLQVVLNLFLYDCHARRLKQQLLPHDRVGVSGADTGTVFRKHLKGPSGSHVSLQIRKPSGMVKTVHLERGNAGYWAIYDQLHKANLDLVSLR